MGPRECTDLTDSAIGKPSRDGRSMTANDHKILFTALGLLAVILKDEPVKHQATRALAIAELIESFCRETVPDAFGDQGSAENHMAAKHRMASVIADIIKTEGTCSPHELKNHGFTPNEIGLYWTMAYALACLSLNIQPSMDS